MLSRCASARRESHHSILHGCCTSPKPVRCRPASALVKGTFDEPMCLVQVQLGPPSRTASPLGETRFRGGSWPHTVPNTCPIPLFDVVYVAAEARPADTRNAETTTVCSRASTASSLRCRWSRSYRGGRTLVTTWKPGLTRNNAPSWSRVLSFLQRPELTIGSRQSP